MIAGREHGQAHLSYERRGGGRSSSTSPNLEPDRAI
jgi:hypothetical protein